MSAGIYRGIHNSQIWKPNGIFKKSFKIQIFVGSRRSPCHRAGEMIPEVEGTRPWGPSRKRVPKCIKGPKTTYTTIAVAEKQSKRSKKGPFSLYIRSPPGPTQEMELRGLEGKVPPGPPRFLQPWPMTALMLRSPFTITLAI